MFLVILRSLILIGLKLGFAGVKVEIGLSYRGTATFLDKAAFCVSL